MSEPKDGGGPAFPCDWKDFQPTTGEQIVRQQFSGMDLRDYFAAKALQGLYAGRQGCIQSECLDLDAELCYAIADAMLKERNK